MALYKRPITITLSLTLMTYCLLLNAGSIRGFGGITQEKILKISMHICVF